MKITLRDYQVKLKQDIYDGWSAGHRNVLAVSPTGSGKALTLGMLTYELAYHHGMPTAILVHRKELVSQLCMTLAQIGIQHNIIAQKDTVIDIKAKQAKKYGKPFYNPNTTVTVVSVDTLLSRLPKYGYWLAQQRAWVLDECAHQLASNKWGAVTQAMPNAIGVGFTATPQRLDKKGLGRHAFGLFDHMVVGPTTRWLIGQGFLSNYKIVVPESDYRKYLQDDGSETKDYTYEARKYASLNSHIIGDVVKNYQKWLWGKQTIVFVDGVEAGLLMEKKYQEVGVPAKFLCAETPAGERAKAIQDFADNKLWVLLNVDLFDEGFDIPAQDGKKIIEAVQMARPTKSLGKYLQIFGRGLRPAFAPGFDLSTAEGRIAAQAASYKPYCIVIDHVGNVKHHMLPDRIRKWTLDNIVKRRDTTNLIRICINVTCNAPFDRALHACPYCGNEDRPASRASGDRKPAESLAMVDGDMELLDPETIRALEKDLELEDPYEMEARITRTVGAAAGINARKKQIERIETQKELSFVISKWAGYMQRQGYSERQVKKMFYNKFEESITGALSLPRADMLIMKNLIEGDLW